MKIITSIYTAALFIVAFSSCEKEINLDLKNTQPKLIVEGNVLLGIDTMITQQELKLSISANYTGTNNPSPVTTASVTVNDGSTTYTYTHIGNGVYRSNFLTAANKMYNLVINYGGDQYKASETLLSGGARIDSLTIKYFPSVLTSDK